LHTSSSSYQENKNKNDNDKDKKDDKDEKIGAASFLFKTMALLLFGSMMYTYLLSVRVQPPDVSILII